MRRTHELAVLFLRLGVLGFGGPAAHVALMEDEVVRRRGWLSRQEFLDLVGAANLIPGPNSTELAIHIGLRRAGWSGLLVAGACFILPASLIVFACARAYVAFGSLPEVSGLLYAVKPVMIAIVFQALIGLTRTAVKSRRLALLGAATAWWQSLSVGLPLGLSAFKATGTDPGAVFLFFLKIGSVLYGSGYVLLAFLQGGLVDQTGLLSAEQLLDAITIGQVTPGPVFTTATFVGYLLGEGKGALAATLGIFLPSFFFVAVTAPFVPRLRASKVFGVFLDGVNVVALALMAVVAVRLTHEAIVDVPTAVVASVSFVLLVKRRVNSAWLILAAALFGLGKTWI